MKQHTRKYLLKNGTEVSIRIRTPKKIDTKNDIDHWDELSELFEKRWGLYADRYCKIWQGDK